MGSVCFLDSGKKAKPVATTAARATEEAMRRWRDGSREAMVAFVLELFSQFVILKVVVVD